MLLLLFADFFKINFLKNSLRNPLNRFSALFAKTKLIWERSGSVVECLTRD